MDGIDREFLYEVAVETVSLPLDSLISVILGFSSLTESGKHDFSRGVVKKIPSGETLTGGREGGILELSSFRHQTEIRC